MKQITYILMLILAISLFAVNGHAVEVLGVEMHGFLSQGYINTTGNNFFGDTKAGTLDFNEIGVNLSKELTGKLRIGLQLLSRDFGAYGNNDLALDWCVVEYRWKDWLGLRGGKLKAPKGLYNENRDVDMVRPTILLPQSVYPEILRDLDLNLIGGNIYGDIGLNHLGDLSYQFMYGTQDVDPNEAASQALQGTTATVTPTVNDSIDVDSKFVAGLVYDTPLDGLRMGVTFDTAVLTATAHFTEGSMAGHTAIADFDKLENTVFSAEYSIGDTVLIAEYIRTRRVFMHEFLEMAPESGAGEIPEGGVPPDGGTLEGGGGPLNAYDITADGWYVGASHQFADWFQLSGYYSESYNDTDDRNGDRISDSHRAYFKDVCLTTGFILNDAWSIKVEGHRFEGTSGVSPLDQVPDESGQVFTEEDWAMFAAKVTFNF